MEREVGQQLYHESFYARRPSLSCDVHENRNALGSSTAEGCFVTDVMLKGALAGFQSAWQAGSMMI